MQYKATAFQYGGSTAADSILVELSPDDWGAFADEVKDNTLDVHLQVEDKFKGTEKQEIARLKNELRRIAMLAERRRDYDRNECCIQMGDIANRALWNRRGPGTGEICTGRRVDHCPNCNAMGRCCAFHAKDGRPT